MKKIISGKRYDTDTAKPVGEWSNNHSCSDFGYCSETLYQKRGGEFFLHGEGGAMSKYAVSHGDNSWGWGEKIIPLSYEEAREWAESHLEADDYEAIFGDVSEDASDFGEQIKAIRARLGLSQVQLAAELQIPKRTWQDWELGTAVPPEWATRLILRELERMEA